MSGGSLSLSMKKMTGFFIDILVCFDDAFILLIRRSFDGTRITIKDDWRNL